MTSSSIVSASSVRPASWWQTASETVARVVTYVRAEHGGRDDDGLFLVTFAGDARAVCPLTHAASTFRLFLDDVRSASNSTGGKLPGGAGN